MRGSALRLLVAILALLSGPGDAAAQVFNFQRYTNRDGLPQIQVFSLHQGRDGHMWFGTLGGLGRYDGTTIRTFTTADGLSANFVADMAEGPTGPLYMATVGGGLCSFEADRFACLTEADGLPSNDVWRVRVEEDGTVWAATAGGLVSVRGGELRAFPVKNERPLGEVPAMTRGPDGTLWVGTLFGLIGFRDGSYERHGHPAFQRRPIPFLLPPDADGGGVLVGTERGVYRIVGDRVEPLPKPPVALPERTVFHSAAVADDGILWITTNEGLLRVDGDDAFLFTQENGLPGKEHTRVMVDREGSIWLGSNAGATKFVPGPLRGYTTAQGLPSPLVWAVRFDPGGRLWVGTQEGVAVSDAHLDRFSEAIPRDELPPGPVIALMPDPRGGMLLGLPWGFARWRDGELRMLGEESGVPNTWTTAFVADGDDAVLVGTRVGVVRWANDEVSRFPADHPLASLSVISMARGSDGRLWIGLASGGVRIWDGETLVALGAEEGLSNQFIWSLAPDPAGGMWVGTNGDGAFRVEGSRVVDRLDTTTGLANDFAWQVLVDSRGALWVYTANGLDRYADGAITHYSVSDGLLDLEGSSGAVLEGPDGRIWFGSASGLMVFDYEAAQPNPVSPPVRIREVALGGQAVDPADRIAFRRGLLQVRYTALSFRDESGVRFRHQLLRGDRLVEGWSPPTPDRTVSFAGLRPGNYTFQVMAINNDGLVSDAPAVLDFTVLPAFWETWWFRLAGLLTLLGAVTAVPAVRSRRLEAERGRLETLVSERTAELAAANDRLREEIRERERMEQALRQAHKMEAVGRLAGGIAHHFNNILTSIMGHAGLASTAVDETHPGHGDLVEVAKGCDRLAVLVAQLLAVGRRQIARPKPISVNDAVARDLPMFGSLLGEGIRLELDLDAREPWIRMDTGQFEQVLLNLLLNARDAMPDGGVVTIRTSIEELTDAHDLEADSGFTPGRYAVLCIADTGTGMSDDTARRAFEPFFTTKAVGEGSGLGLSSVYGIVKQNRGHVRLETAAGTGTNLRIYLPISAGADAPPPPGPPDGGFHEAGSDTKAHARTVEAR